MFRFEGPILNPALALRPILGLRPVLASALYACVRQPPKSARPLCAALSMPASPAAATLLCFAAPARMSRAASTHAGKVRRRAVRVWPRQSRGGIFSMETIFQQK